MTNPIGSISLQIMPIVINSLGGKLTDTHTHARTHIHTLAHTHTDLLLKQVDILIFKNQAQ